MINKIQVENMKTSGGNPAPNHFIISCEGSTIYQSYQSIVCVVNHEENTITFGKDWDYSPTTIKYLGRFLADRSSLECDMCNAKGIRKAIKDGTIPSKPFRFGKDITIIYDGGL